MFIVVAAGFALIILLPTLFFTTLVATFLWLWGMGTYYILKYFNKKDIPGIHTPLKDLAGGSENDKLDALNGKPNGARAAPKLEKKESTEGEKKSNGNASTGKSSGADLGNGLSEVQKRLDPGNATKTVGDVKDKVDGMTKNLPTGSVTEKLPLDSVTGGLGLGS